MEPKIPNLLKLRQAAWGIAGGLASLGIISIASPATAITLDGGSDFDFFFEPTTIAGVGTPDGTLNVAPGNDGFNEFFTTDYGRLGEFDFITATNPFLNDLGTSGAVSLETISFSEPELANLLSIQVTFDYAFAGTAGNPGGDTVEVFLRNSVTEVAATPSFEITTLEPSGIPSFTFELTGGDLAALEAETPYNLVFQLTEASDVFNPDNPISSPNTAFGFDDVVVDPVPIPFEAEFSSVAGLLMLGGFWGFSRLKKRARKAS